MPHYCIIYFSLMHIFSSDFFTKAYACVYVQRTPTIGALCLLSQRTKAVTSAKHSLRQAQSECNINPVRTMQPLSALQEFL